MVQEMTVTDLKELLDSEEQVRLYDVRTEAEREICTIDGAVLLTQEVADAIAELPKETKLVFHCHHGGRSFQAASYFLQMGFPNVVNVTGGINAWSLTIDPTVARY
jgi:monothiol glutaredoxin